MQDQIKSHLTDLMLAAPPRVRFQLSEALSIISAHDFPARWPTLLPGLLERLDTPDEQRLAGLLATADSIFQRYRNQYMTSELSRELEYSQQLVRPLLATLRRLAPRAAETAADPAAQALVLSNLRAVVSIFYSLNSPGLTDVRSLGSLRVQGWVGGWVRGVGRGCAWGGCARGVARGGVARGGNRKGGATRRAVRLERATAVEAA